MRVALLSKRSPHCGVVGYSALLEAHLQRQGCSVDVCHFATPNDARSGDVRLPWWFKSQQYSWPAPGATRRLREALVAAKPDLIHAHLTVSPLDLWLPQVARELGVPLLGTFHTGWDHRPTLVGRSMRALYRLYAPALAAYDRVIVFGSEQRQAFLDRGVPSERLVILPNGIDVAAYQPGPSPYRLSAGLRVTYMGRMVGEKNVTALVESFVAAAVPQVTLTMVGDGPLLPKLRARFGQQTNLEWRGHVADEAERQAIWRGSDVVVLPSDIEGLSLSLLEGMASGCMPVATDVGAHREVLEGVGRILDPLRLRADLDAAWLWLVAHPDEVRRSGESARNRVAECYTLEKHWSRLGALYEELCGFQSLHRGLTPSSSPL